MTTQASPGLITIGGDLRVRRIGYGAMQLTGEQVWGPYPDHGHAIEVLRGVVDSGINLIDTADVYGPHDNELLIREALHPIPRGWSSRRRAALSGAASTTARSMRSATRTTCGRAPI
jgi:aryl-alcohol dehydrogenase-like predicted oxidoreductase